MLALDRAIRNKPQMADTEFLADNATDDSPLLFGRVLDGNCGGRPVDWSQALQWQPGVPGEVLWVHLDRTRPEVAEWLEQSLGIPEPTAKLLTSDSTRPRAFREGDALVATLRGINFNPGAQPEDMVSMQIWSDGQRLVSLRRHPLQTPRDTLAQIDAGKGPRDAGALLTELTERLVAGMNRSIADMNDQIDQLEDADGKSGEVLGEIVLIRRNCLALQRHMGPQHEALENIAHDAPAWFDQDDRREIAETIDRLHRFLDDINISKESALMLQDELRARALARSDRTSYLLAIIASVFLPLSFFTGLLGINVKGIPSADRPHAFWVVVLICLSIFAVQMFLFRKWKWL